MHVPLAHTEGGLTASMTRGALAAGTIRTYVLVRPHHARVVLRLRRRRARRSRSRRWVEAELPAMQAWLAALGRPVALEAREAS